MRQKLNKLWFSEAMKLLTQDALAPLPLCRPTDPDKCSARWHDAPCPSAGKRPLVKGYQAFKDVPPSRECLAHWAAQLPALNLGGVVRTGYLVVEADSPDADTELLDIMPELATLAPCRAARPGRGRAWILATPGISTLGNRAALGVSKKIDVRGPGGLLVLPPSLHRTGHVVTWAPGRSITDLVPCAANSALLELVTPKPRKTGRGPKLSCGNRRSTPSQSNQSVEIPAIVKHLISACLEFRRLWYGTGKQYGDTSRSGYDFAVACFLLDVNVPKQTVIQALRSRPGVKDRSHEYARMTVEAALSRKGQRRR